MRDVGMKYAADRPMSHRGERHVQPDDERVDGIADEIERYVNTRLDSADTLEGIAKWWIEQTRLRNRST